MILACSPRRGGNCDAAAELVRDAANAHEPVRLRDHAILPCSGCQACASAPGICPLRDKDDAEKLMRAIDGAPRLVLIAPIYFYHLPAQLKALIDRSQSRWFLPREAGPPRKKAHIILIAGRKRGDSLFTGSLLTCRYWLDLFGFTLAEPHCIYGVDEPGDLMRDVSAREGLAAYARAIGG